MRHKQKWEAIKSTTKEKYILNQKKNKYNKNDIYELQQGVVKWMIQENTR
jgi:hypothetical protein